MSYRTPRGSGYEYESLTKLSELPGIVAKAYIASRISGQGKNKMYPYPGALWHRRTELPEVPGTGMSVPRKLQKFFVG